MNDLLREQIRTGTWKPGDRIPSEAEIREHYSVSRAIVRQALADLDMDGHVVRHQGRGTFVAEPKIEMKLHDFYSFAEELAARGLQPESRVVEFEVVIPKPDVREALALEVQEPLVKLVRLRLTRGEIIMLETTYLAEQLVPGLTEEDFGTHSLYSLLEDRYGMRLERAIESFEPVLVDDFASKMLEVPKDSPVLFLERIVSLADGRCVELSQSVVRGDKCKYFVGLLR